MNPATEQTNKLLEQPGVSNKGEPEHSVMCSLDEE